MMNELPIIPPLHWNLGGAPMLLPFSAHTNINLPSLIPDHDSGDSSSDEDESRVNCNVQ